MPNSILRRLWGPRLRIAAMAAAVLAGTSLAGRPSGAQDDGGTGRQNQPSPPVEDRNGQARGAGERGGRPAQAYDERSGPAGPGGPMGAVGSLSVSEAALVHGRNVASTGGRDVGAGNACVLCHGMDGAGDSSGAFPRLSGQPAWYLYKQLEDYASGERPNEIMSPIARALTRLEREDVAAYYATREGARPLPESWADALVLQQGGKLSAVGAPEKGIQACVYCHGPAGAGNPPSFPMLAGQYAPYQELQLRLFKEGVRRNDPLGVMRRIAEAMTEEQMRAVSLYFASVRPPVPPVPTEAAPAAAQASRPAVARPSGEEARRLVGIEVSTTDADRLGTVGDIEIDPATGQVQSIVVVEEGMLGFRETRRTLPWSRVEAWTGSTLVVTDRDEGARSP